jgi:hypothetical protein
LSEKSIFAEPAACWVVEHRFRADSILGVTPELHPANEAGVVRVGPEYRPGLVVMLLEACAFGDAAMRADSRHLGFH